MSARRVASVSAGARSPLLAFGVLCASALICLGLATGRPALAVAVLVVQVLLGLFWLVVLGAPLTTAVLVGLAGLAADSVLLRSRTTTAGSVAGVLGLAMLAAIVQQLLRRNRREVTEGFATAISGVVLVIAASLLLPLRESAQGEGVALTALVGVAVGVVVARLMPGPILPIRLAALLAAALIGGRYGAVAENLEAVRALATAAAAAAAALVLDLGMVRVAGEVDARQLAALRPVAVLLPLVAAVPVAYVVGWALAGA